MAVPTCVFLTLQRTAVTGSWMTGDTFFASIPWLRPESRPEETVDLCPGQPPVLLPAPPHFPFLAGDVTSTSSAGNTWLAVMAFYQVPIMVRCVPLYYF